jgi:hypothetical protein
MSKFGGLQNRNPLFGGSPLTHFPVRVLITLSRGWAAISSGRKQPTKNKMT